MSSRPRGTFRAGVPGNNLGRSTARVMNSRLRLPPDPTNALCLAVLLSLGPLGRSQPLYSVTDLGVLPGHARSEAVAINNLGQVVGFSLVPGTTDYRAFLFSNGRLQDLGTAGWEASVAADINDAGQIAINCYRPDPRRPGYHVVHAFLYAQGAWTDLGTSSPWKDSIARGLNHGGEVVGEEYDGTNTFAFLASAGGKRHLADARGPITNAVAYAINDVGQVLLADEDGTYVHRGVTLDRFVLPGNGNYSLRALNVHGQAVGHYEVDVPEDPDDPDSEIFSLRRAFRWSGGAVADLAGAGCLDSIAFDINRHGQATGYCLSAAAGGLPGPRAVLFQGSAVLDLNSLIPPNSGWVLTHGQAINDLGQIVCLGSRDGVRAVLLTPPLCTLAPARATNRLDATHEVVCTVRSNAVPLVGVTVEFTVSSGPNAGRPETTRSEVTDTAGQARFRYDGQGGAGTDVVRARARLGPLELEAEAQAVWEAGIELHPRLVLGCPGGQKTLELVDTGTGQDITADPSVTYEWVGDDWLSNLAWKALEKVLPRVAGWRAQLDVRNGRVSFLTKGVNLIQAKRQTAQGELKSNYAFVAVGVIELSKLDSIQIGALSAVNLATDSAAGQLASALGAESPVRLPMILFPVEQRPCGGAVQKLGNYGLVELRSIQFHFLGGLISDVDLMNAVGPLVGLASKAFPLAWFSEALSTRAAQVGAAQLLDFNICGPPKTTNPFIDLATDNSEFPFLRGKVTAKKSGVAAIQATLDLESYCLGKATDVMWVWVLPDLEQADIRNAQGQVVRDAQGQELPLPVWVRQSTQARAVGMFKSFAEAGSIPIQFDPLGLAESDLAKLAEKLLPNYEKIQDRVGVTIPIRYPLGATLGPSGLYEAGPTYLALDLTYLPMQPAIRVDQCRLQLPMWDGFNTWTLDPPVNPYVTLDPASATLTGVAPGLTDLDLGVCLFGLSRGTDTARVRVLAGDPVCSVNPAAATLAVGEETAIQAVVMVDGQPAPPGEVNFLVMSGPNAGRKGSATGPTARFAYRGEGGPGTDRLEVVGFVWGRSFGCSATRTWELPQVVCVLSPNAATNLVGSSHTVTARVISNGRPVSGAEVHFLITSGPHAGQRRVATTGADGQTVFAYRGDRPGTDVIEATGLAGSGAFGGSATATWWAPKADLALAKSASPSPGTAGEPLTYTLTVRNLGPDDASGVTLTDSLPPGADLVSSASSQGACTGTSPVVCSLGGLARNGSATVVVVVRPRQTGLILNSAMVSAREFDPNAGNNAATASTLVQEKPQHEKADLALSLSHTPAIVYPGQRLTCDITVRNLGPARSTGVRVTHTFPTPVRLVSSAPSQGGCRGLGPMVWELGGLASNATASLKFVVRPLAAGRLDGRASVTGHPPDPNPANNDAVDSLTVGSGPIITRVTPAATPPGVEDLELEIHGAGFTPGAVLSFEPATGLDVWADPLPDFGYVSSSELRRYVRIAPDAPAGMREVFITNLEGGSGGGLPFGQFTVLAATQPLPPPAGLTLWLAGEGDASDRIGGVSGTLEHGAKADAPGVVGQAFRFDGVDDAVVVPSTLALNPSGMAPLTVEAWVFRTSTTPAMQLLGKQNGCDLAGLQYSLGLDPSTGLYFETPDAFVITEEDLPLNRWTHVAVTCDGVDIGVFVDGLLFGLDAGTLGPATAAPLVLGGTGSCGPRFGGWIDEFCVYNRALSETEVYLLAAAKAGKARRSVAPALAVAAGDARSIRLNWPVGAVGWVLEESGDLGAGAIWVPAAALPGVVNQQYAVTLNPDGGTRYYRLRQR